MLYYDENIVLQVDSWLPDEGVYYGKDGFLEFATRAQNTMKLLASPELEILAVDEAKMISVTKVTSNLRMLRTGTEVNDAICIEVAYYNRHGRVQRSHLFAVTYDKLLDAYWTRAEKLTYRLSDTWYKQRSMSAFWDLVAPTATLKLTMFPSDFFRQTVYTGRRGMRDFASEVFQKLHAKALCGLKARPSNDKQIDLCVMSNLLKVVLQKRYEILFANDSLVAQKIETSRLHPYGGNWTIYLTMRFDSAGLLEFVHIVVPRSLEPWVLYPSPRPDREDNEDNSERSAETTGAHGGGSEFSVRQQEQSSLFTEVPLRTTASHYDTFGAV